MEGIFKLKFQTVLGRNQRRDYLEGLWGLEMYSMQYVISTPSQSGQLLSVINSGYCWPEPYVNM